MAVASLNFLSNHVASLWVAFALTLLFLLQISFRLTKKRSTSILTRSTVNKNYERFYDWLTDILKNSQNQSREFSFPGGKRGFFTANPVDVEHILIKNFKNYKKRIDDGLVLQDFLGKGIINSKGDVSTQREAASIQFSPRAVRIFAEEILESEIVHRLIPFLSNACSKGVSINLQDVLQRFAFDNICRAALGVDPACLDPSLPDTSFAQDFEVATELCFGRFFYHAPFVWRIKRALNVGSERRLREAIRGVDDFAMRIIRSRRKDVEEEKIKGSGPIRNDYLSRWIIAFTSMNQMDADEQNLMGIEETVSTTDPTDVFLRDMIINFMLLGRDTIFTSLTWFFWVLSSHPRVEAAIHKEITEILAKRKVRQGQSKDSNGVVFTIEELSQMKYLHAALFESMRLYPPLAVNSRIAVGDDVLPTGMALRPGWIVDYSAYAMGRMETIWGEDCLEFRPHRWLKNGEFVEENPCKFPVFHAGPRICMGKEMALVEMKSTVASVIHRFSLMVDNKFVPRYAMDFHLRMKGGMEVTVRQRQ